MATILLAAGKERLALPHSRFMLHLPSGGFNGEVKEAELRTREMVKTLHTLVDCYIECGVTAEVAVGNIPKIRKQILKDIDREFWIGAKEAITYGLIDRIATTDELFGLPLLTNAMSYNTDSNTTIANTRTGTVYS
jgi:ATP-dependent Clp protease protease subunit